ncbi:MAG: hypothetical protein MPK10_06915 [Gammaproteobacteria bacterium]|nr:hypothetical protein [Gammaproteobacteria bacterium]CAJ2375848.1 MAG: hypothetical protein IBGAMO2_130049 [Arenicellales bacterium IbO2]MDA7962746.1 hypothetical protein [Gammaproteobacteria bacterium]MDA7972282.1 hypothetical protein [Gammaproteobacteria bacterium]MDA7996032.1 hypothetical protein [Gammaproteobacteria bacterium]
MKTKIADMISKTAATALPRAALVAAALSVGACGPGVRLADGDCYYKGKGLLQTLATGLDSLSDYGEAVQEQNYQRDQVNLQRLSAELDAVDLDALDRRQNYAYAINDAQAMAQIDAEIGNYNAAVEEEKALQKRISDYQAKKAKELKEGSDKSLSQTVADSGDCPD